MDKPMSMSIKDYLMRTQSVRTNTPLKTIEAVIDFQYQEANLALQLPNIHSVEISGFGKMVFSMKKAITKYKKNQGKKDYWENALLSPDLTEAKRKSIQTKLENTIKWMEYIKPKLHLDEQVERISSPIAESTS